MKPRFRIFKRSSGVFYLEDTVSLHPESLKTKDKTIAERIISAKNQAHEQPALNLQMARTYLAASDPAVVERTWQVVMDIMASSKKGSTLERWVRAIKDHAFDTIRDRRILETRAEDFWAVLRQGTVATNVFLRRIHNFALDMGWLPWPVIPKRQWPKVEYGEKRAITFVEHMDIVDREQNPERKAGGLGHFIGLMPEAMSARSRITGVEIDSQTHPPAKSRRDDTGQRARAVDNERDEDHPLPFE